MLMEISQFTVFLPLLFSKPNSGHMFTEEGELRKIILGETEVDLHSHCLLTGEVRNPRLLASVIQSLTSWSRRSCVTITRNLNEACKDLYPTIGLRKSDKRRNKVFKFHPLVLLC